MAHDWGPYVHLQSAIDRLLLLQSRPGTGHGLVLDMVWYSFHVLAAGTPVQGIL